MTIYHIETHSYPSDISASNSLNGGSIPFGVGPECVFIWWTPRYYQRLGIVSYHRTKPEQSLY